jgi:tryptophan synthase alpha chain
MTPPGAKAGARLEATFGQARRRGRAILVPYITGGFPSPGACARLIDGFLAAGADMVELGVPYSDPVADGPVVQASAQRALAQGVTTSGVLSLAAAHSDRAPFVLLAYVNTVLALKPERFFERCALNGVDGVVMPDLPADEADELMATAAAHGVAAVLLAAPTSSDARLDLIARKARGFIYCVAVTGVTGARAQGRDELPELVARLRARTELPLVAGFGIGTPEQARDAGRLCDGVIIGSALIDLVARSADVDAACAATGDLLRAARAALDAG